MKKQEKKSKQTLSRRKFLATTGGLTFAVVGYPLLSNAWFEDEAQPVEKQVTAWVEINPNEQITIYNPASEMGQGSMTALAVLVAEEMDADWSKVKIVHSPIEPSVYGRSWGRGRTKGGGTMMTVGSYTVSGYYDNLRHAGAQVRYVLLNAVAKKWKVPMQELTTRDSLVIHKKTNRKISYGKITAFVNIPKSIPEIPVGQLKSPAQFRLIGKNNPRYDIPEKINGSAMYAMDVRLPNMAYAVMQRSPVHRTKPTLKNQQAILKMPGVIKIITLKHGVAVVAKTIEQALEAKKKLDITWDGTPTAMTHDSQKAFNDYEKIAGDDNQSWRSLKNSGNFKEGVNTAKKTYSLDYKNDYLCHAQMEPLNAVVSMAKDGKSAEVWVGTQAPGRARQAAAKALGLDVSKVKLNPHYLGGGFGRRSLADYLTEATLIAKQLPQPVKLIWTREDDIQYGAFRPLSLQRMEAGVDAKGNIVNWSHRIIGTGGRLLSSGARTNYYTFADQRIQLKNIDHGIRTKHWRSVGHGPNKFAIEAFINEVAYDQKIDPLKIREQLMKNHPRALKVLREAAKMANWGSKLPKGRAQGIAFGERSGSLAAGVVEISLDEEGKIKVHKAWCAFDAGIVVQPDNAIAQMEGGILWGIGSTLKESITIKGGKVQQSNFNDYHILRMSDTPEVLEVKIIASNEPPTGIGETGLPWVGGAIAGAFLNLKGKALRHLPLTPEKIKDVLGK